MHLHILLLTFLILFMFLRECRQPQECQQAATTKLEVLSVVANESSSNNGTAHARRSEPEAQNIATEVVPKLPPRLSNVEPRARGPPYSTLIAHAT